MNGTLAGRAFDQLADALDRLPNGFPRTESNVEVDLLKRIFSTDEASLAAQLTGSMEPVSSISERVDMPVRELRKSLMAMVKRGFVWFDKGAGEPRFRLAPFVVGIYEAQLENMDHELAHLFERCQVEALTEIDGAAAVLRDKCLGCGLCVTTCPTDAAQLQPKPESEIVPPPADYAALEEARLKHRAASGERGA